MKIQKNLLFSLKSTDIYNINSDFLKEHERLLVFETIADYNPKSYHFFQETKQYS